ncbi:Rha family transcriptional regulator [Shewanella algae]|uniref:Rha family transcriptional regulator n=1 Tax=Shewanella algae TaxID=38313 RepID=UPI0031F51696
MNKANTIPSLNHLVCAQDGALITTSINVAEAFGKQHKDVLRRLQALDCSTDFTERNFTPSGYFDSTGRKLPMWQMTKDGFMFLVMGFTGKKAAAIKEAYINAFNWMAEQLSGASRQKTTTDDRTGLRNAVNLLVSKKGLMYPDAYAMVHQRFNVEHLDQLDKNQLTEAIEYVHKLALEGELLPRGSDEMRTLVHSANGSFHHLQCIYKAWITELEPALRQIRSPIGAELRDHVLAGMSFSSTVKNELERSSGLIGFQY